MTPKQEAFVHRYIECGDAVEAYKAAYDVSPTASPNGTRVDAYNLTRHPLVARRLRELSAAAAESAVITAAELRARQYQIATAPPLTHVRVFNCRQCPSGGKHYAWTDVDEFTDACEAWAASKGTERRPSPLGGFAFDPFAPPNPSCRKCRGVGEQFVYLADTTQLEGAAAASFKGASMDKYGVIKIEQHDPQDAAFELNRMVPGAMAATRSIAANVNVNVPIPDNLSPADALAFLETLKPS